MGKAYLLNDYINEYDENKKQSLYADEYLQNYLFRVNGSKTIEELKKEVNIFLEQNDVDIELKNKLINICDSLNENSDLYSSFIKLENTVRDYVYEKNKSFENSEQQIDEIKSDLIEDNLNRLDSVGIHVSGSIDAIKDSIKNEDDVYHFEKNVDEAVNYYHDRNNIVNSSSVIETSINDLENVIQKTGESQILDTVLNEEKRELVNSNNSLNVNDNGTIEINSSNTNSEAMNFVTMMTLLLVTNNSNFYLNTDMDMKFIKEENNENDFKIVYGNFPLSQNGTSLDPALEKQIYDLANSYDSNVSYTELLNMTSPELKMALQIVEENIFGQTGEFKMAVKSNGSGYDIKMGFDENYQDIIDAFYENGAFTIEGMDGNVEVMIPNNMDQMVLLNAVLETLKQKGYTEEQANNLVDQYQKKLIYKNESANIPVQLLLVITFACVIEILGFLYFIMK